MNASYGVLYGYPVYQEDMDRLTGVQWYNDTIIDVAAAHYLHLSDDADALIFPSLWTAALLQSGDLTKVPVDMTGQNFAQVQLNILPYV